MANEKQYLEVFNDGQDDLYIRDQEAQEELSQIPTIYATKAALTQATIIPVNLDTMTPSTTFVQNNIVAIKGIQYRAKRNTSEFPITLQVQDGHFVGEIVDGAPTFVVEDWTLSDDWEVWGDASIPQTLYSMQDDQAMFIAEARRILAISVKYGELITNTAGTKSYTVRQLLTALADLMDKEVVAGEPEVSE